MKVRRGERKKGKKGGGSSAHPFCGTCEMSSITMLIRRKKGKRGGPRREKISVRRGGGGREPGGR